MSHTGKSGHKGCAIRGKQKNCNTERKLKQSARAVIESVIIDFHFAVDVKYSVKVSLQTLCNQWGRVVFQIPQNYTVDLYNSILQI